VSQGIIPRSRDAAVQLDSLFGYLRTQRLIMNFGGQSAYEYVGDYPLRQPRKQPEWPWTWPAPAGTQYPHTGAAAWNLPIGTPELLALSSGRVSGDVAGRLSIAPTVSAQGRRGASGRSVLNGVEASRPDSSFGLGHVRNRLTAFADRSRGVVATLTPVGWSASTINRLMPC